MAPDHNTIIKPFILVLLLLISTSASSSKRPLCLTKQRDALIQFNKTFATDSYYARTGSWQNDTDCCMWDGVTCDNKTGDVINLDLYNFGLQGTIDNISSLVFLQNLQSLDLSENELDGSLSSFPQLPNLLHLDLSYCHLHGTIDNISSLFFLRNLQSLYLNDNDLNGSLSSFPQHPKLLHLDLSSNEFSSISHEIAHLSQLISLNLTRNYGLKIASSTLDLLIQNLTNIQELRLDNVTIDGVLASSPINLSIALSHLSLSSCSLKGRFPDYIFHLPNLHLLDVSQNLGLTGILPSLNWSSPLFYLDLSSTGFSGNIPNSIGNIKDLETLNLDSCQFTNLIPWSICSLSSLKELFLSGNIFSGMIPHCLGNLTKLQQLDMSLNQLTGPLPRSLNNCILLELMDVSSNMLSDMFPSWLRNLPKLSSVYLGKNRFYGSIDGLINGTSLSRLDLHQNSFSGHLPDFVGNSSLSILDLSSNSLEGPIPKLPQDLDFLSLSNNNFTGVLLPICESLPGVLELANNSLTGTIPPCLRNCRDIILGMNKLEGAIPDVFTEHCDISGLIISRNQLTGPLPRSMVNCPLRFLDLSHNSIEDSFPNWLETLSSLQIFDLQSNRFYGELKTLSNNSFPSLKVVDISKNNLTGPLPIEYFNGLDPTKINPAIWHEVPDLCEYFTGPYLCGYYYKFMFTVKGSTLEFLKPTDYLALIDLSNNNFQGEIPEAIGKLSFLKGLNLSNNNLTGSIPPSIQNLTDLEWLDLSSNQLNGVIPSELTDLTELSSLNLSYNELSGMIPSGKQFNTFEKESFVL